MKKKPKHISIPLNQILITIFCVVILLLFLITAFLFYNQNQNIALDVATKFEIIASEQVIDKFEQYVQEAENGLIGVEELIVRKIIDLSKDPEHIKENLSTLLISKPSVNALYIADFEGRFYMAKRMPDNTISTRFVLRIKDKIISQWKHAKPDNSFKFAEYTEDTLEEGYDPRKRSWYKNANFDHIKWTSPYIFFSDKKTGITATKRIKFNNYTSVIAVDIELNALNTFIDELFFSRYGTILVLDKNNHVISFTDTLSNSGRRTRTSINYAFNSDLISLNQISITPELKHVLGIIDKNHGMPPLTQEYKLLPVLTNLLFPSELANSLDNLNISSRIRASALDYQGKRYIYAHTRINSFDGIDWKFFFLMKDSSVVGKYRNKIKLVLVLISLIFAISLFYYSRFLKNFSNKLKELSSLMNNISSLKLDTKYESKSILMVSEIEQIGNIYNRVIKSLSSFKKFIPRKVIQYSIDHDKELDVFMEQKTGLTFLFSDIISFTSITEQHTPEELAVALNIYFTTLTDIITSCNGIIDKFIGDAIMATFGLFKEENKTSYNHAELACLAALKMQKAHERINTLIARKNIDIVFQTRIGLNSGDALVGMIGSSTKLNYTAIGDTVNVSSRLEGLNKQYNTKIIISKSTRDLLSDEFMIKKLDELQVKGKEEATEIYRLYGWKCAQPTLSEVEQQSKLLELKSKKDKMEYDEDPYDEDYDDFEEDYDEDPYEEDYDDFEEDYDEDPYEEDYDDFEEDYDDFEDEEVTENDDGENKEE